MSTGARESIAAVDIVQDASQHKRFLREEVYRHFTWRMIAVDKYAQVRGRGLIHVVTGPLSKAMFITSGASTLLTLATYALQTMCVEKDDFASIV